MKAGDLRDLIRVERQTETADDMGNVRGQWASIGDFWADVRVVPGKERVAAGTVEATALATVRVRNQPETAAITGADRIVMRGATWNIRNQPVPAGPRREMIEMICEAGVAT